MQIYIYYSTNGNSDNNDVIFQGTIKNKSELKFILKSIGVLEENK